MEFLRGRLIFVEKNLNMASYRESPIERSSKIFVSECVEPHKTATRLSCREAITAKKLIRLRP
jgi:hypothetical protein